jgi:hypothetical protein
MGNDCVPPVLANDLIEWLCKGAGHKYLRRIPTGDPKRKWRYIYAAQSKHHDSEFSAGEKIRITHGKQVGHYEVKSLHGAYVTLKHDETGHEVSVHKDRLAEMFKDEHRRAGAGQRKRTVKAAAQAKAAAVAQEAYEASKQAKTSTGASHEKAAELHTKAADAGADHAALHRELAVAHKRAAQTIQARAKAKLPKKKFVLRLERHPKPGYLGTKQQAWDALMDSISGETPGDFHVTDAKYQEWKRRGGRKPPPYTGGELDTVNDALGLFAPNRSERLRGKKDPRVSSLREGFERLTANVKRWDDPRMRDAIDALRGVDGLERIRVPGGKAGGGVTRGRRIAKEQEAYYQEMREAQSQALDTGFDPDEIEASPDFDTSFDFGFNAEAVKSMSNDAINDIGEYLEKAHKYVKRTGTPGNYQYEYETAGGQKRTTPSRGAVATKEGERKQAQVKEKRGFQFSIPGTKMSVSAMVDSKMGRRTTYTLHIVGPNQLRTGAKIDAVEESGKLISFEATSTRGTDVKPIPKGAMGAIKQAFEKERGKIQSLLPKETTPSGVTYSPVGKKSMTIRKNLDASENLDKSYGRVDEWADQFRGTPLYRSDDAISALSKSLEKGKVEIEIETDEDEDEAKKALPSDTASVSPTKARQILHDGEVHGKPLTDQQRKFFGAIGGHLPAPGKEARKSMMDSIDAMEEFAKGHGSTVGETVTSSPQKNLGDAGALSGDNAAGAGPLPRDDADGGAGLGTGTTGRPPAPNTSGEAPGGKLSEDDEDVEDQMADKPAPGQQRRGSQLMMGRYRKSVIEGVGDTGGRMSPGVQLEAQAHDRAVAISRLHKSDDVAFGASEPQTEEGVQVFEKATHKRVGDLVHMSNVSDLEVERMQKSSDFYHGASPDVGVAANLRKSQPCVGGGDHLMSAHLTTCDTCGAGRSGGYAGAGIELLKSGRGLARPPRPDLDLSKGLTIPDDEE